MAGDEAETRWSTMVLLPWSKSALEGHTCFLFVIAATKTFEKRTKFYKNWNRELLSHEIVLYK